MKHKRFFYFLKDTVTNQFYTGVNISLDVFDKAAVYFQKKNVEKKLKYLIDVRRCGSWPWCKKHGTTKKEKELVNKRKNLYNWGIEIVEVEVSV